MVKIAYIELEFPCWKVYGMISRRLQCLCAVSSVYVCMGRMMVQQVVRWTNHQSMAGDAVQLGRSAKCSIALAMHYRLHQYNHQRPYA